MLQVNFLNLFLGDVERSGYEEGHPGTTARDLITAYHTPDEGFYRHVCSRVLSVSYGGPVGSVYNVGLET